MGIANITNNILTDSGVLVSSLPSGSGVTNELTYWTSSSVISSLTTATYPSLTELSYVKGITSSLQTQLNAKQDTLNGTGFVKAVGTVISYDNSTYLTANESITLSGAVTGTGTTAITTTLANSIVGIANLSATGTPDSTTYLRGDNTWATVAGGSMAIGGSITSATAGSVLFAGTSGILQQDNANFFWDDTTNRLGIGTSSPTAPLSVGASRLLLFSDTPTNASATTKMGYMFSTIGTTGSTPSGSFVEDTNTGTILSYGVNVVQAGTRNTAYVGGIFRLDTRAIEQRFVVLGYPTGGSVQNERISVNLQTGETYLNGVAGNTGVGYASSTSLSYKLDVNGTGRYQGDLLVSKNQNAATTFDISNTTSGTASQTQIQTISDATSGLLGVGKTSSTYATYKIIVAKDAYIYNNTVAGDIAILNDFASGTIKLAAGGSSLSHVTIATTGLTTFSTGIVYKRLNPTTTTVASTATLTPDISLGDTFTITAQAAALSVANPTGTPVNGQKIIIRIKDSGAARGISWSTGANGYRASTDLALPTTTIISKTMYLGFIWNSTDNRWDLLAFLNNF